MITFKGVQAAAWQRPMLDPGIRSVIERQGYRALGRDEVRLEGARQLYRAVPQSRFEVQTVGASHKYGTPCYFSETFASESTFTSSRFFGVLDYLNRYSEYTGDPEKRLPPPFTDWGMLMAIDAAQYLDRLYVNEEHCDLDGVLIVGPIDLRDISILFSTRIDRLDQWLVKLAEVSSAGSVVGLASGGIRSRMENLRVLTNGLERKDLIEHLQQNAEEAYAEITASYRDIAPRDELADILAVIVRLFTVGKI